jgi:hypothetical protein
MGPVGASGDGFQDAVAFSGTGTTEYTLCSFRRHENCGVSLFIIA